MLVRTVWMATFFAAVAGIGRADRPETNATLVGKAAFRARPLTDRGSVRLIVHGLGDIGDACPDANARQFVATYDGELAVAEDGQFTAPLYPTSPAIATPSGCTVRDLHVDHVTAIEVAARLGALVGHGDLTFQNLAGVDAGELSAGAFDELHATLVFSPEEPCTCGT